MVQLCFSDEFGSDSILFLRRNNSIHETVHIYRGCTPHERRFKVCKC
jgi:hypothetical protein